MKQIPVLRKGDLEQHSMHPIAKVRQLDQADHKPVSRVEQIKFCFRISTMRQELAALRSAESRHATLTSSSEGSTPINSRRNVSLHSSVLKLAIASDSFSGAEKLFAVDPFMRISIRFL